MTRKIMLSGNIYWSSVPQSYFRILVVQIYFLQDLVKVFGLFLKWNKIKCSKIFIKITKMLNEKYQAVFHELSVSGLLKRMINLFWNQSWYVIGFYIYFLEWFVLKMMFLACKLWQKGVRHFIAFCSKNG